MFKHGLGGNGSTLVNTYPTANYTSILYTKYSILSSEPFINISISPNLGETEADFWVRAGSEITNLLTLEIGAAISPVIFYVINNGANSELYVSNYINILLKGYQTIKLIGRETVSNKTLNTEWQLFETDLTDLYATSYNNQLLKNNLGL